MSIGWSDHALGAFYQRLSVRAGKAKAIKTTARTIAILVYSPLRDGLIYSEQAAREYDLSQVHRRLRAGRKRAASLGFELINTATGLIME
jgi:transposase